MALTRVTSTVIEDNAVSADKLGNASITGPMIAAGSITADKLGANVATDGPASGQIARVNTNLSANVNSVNANLTSERGNVNAITDATTDINLNSGKFFIDKSHGGLGLENSNPVLSSISAGTPANVIINYGSAKGNVLIGTGDPTTAFRLDVRGTANVGGLTATSLSGPSALTVSDGGTVGSASTTDAMTIASDGIVTFKDDIKIKNDGTIGSAGAATAMTIDSSGIVTFVDDIKIKDGGTIGVTSAATAMTIASDGIVTFVDDIKIKDSGTIGSASAPTAMTIASDGVVTFGDDIKIKDDGTFGTATTPTAFTIAADGDTAISGGLGVAGNTGPVAGELSLGTPANVIIRATATHSGNVVIGNPTGTASHNLDVRGTANVGALTSTSHTSAGALQGTTLTLTADGGVQVPNDGNIGSAGATDAMQISSAGIVTFKDDIKIKDGGTIGSASSATAMTIASDGIVTFVDDIKIKDGGTIGSATTPAAITVASDGIVTFADDIKIKNDGTIGSAGAATAMTIDSSGIVTFVDDIKIKDGGTIGVASKADAITIASDGDTVIAGGLGISGNTDPLATGISIGDPANVVIRTHAASGKGNVIIGDATAVSGFNLDVRGTASVGALTSTSHTSTGAIQGTTLTLTADGGVQVPNDGNIGSAGATDAMQISSGGIVTFKDDIKIKDGGTIGSASSTTAITIASDGIVTFVDDIKIKDDGTIGSASAATAMTIDASGIVTFVDDIKIKDGGTIGSATDPAAITIAAAGGVTFSDRSTHSGGITIADGGQIGTATTAAAVTLAADGKMTVADDLIVTGDFTVLGSTTTVNTENLVIQDNFLRLANSQPTDTATSLDSGMFFNRGSAGNAALYYDQSATGFRLSETRDPISNTSISPTHDANLTLSNLFAQTIQVPNDGKIGSAGSTSAMTISSGGIVTFADDIKIKDGGTIGSATTPAAITVASDGIVTFADDIKIKNDGTIGSAGAATAMSIDSSGIVTFVDDIKIKDDGTIGSASAATAMTIDASGIVTFVDDIKIKDGGTIGSASAATAMTIASDGIVTFVDDIKIKDGGTIGSASAPTAMTIASDGVVTFVDDIKIKDSGTFGTATTPAAFTIAADGDTAISGGLGVAGNTGPVAGELSLGTPANVIIRATAAHSGNVVIGNPTGTASHNLDVRGTANVGALISTSHTSAGAIQGTTLTLTADGGVQVPNDGNIGSAGATDAMQISSGGIVTFKDDIKIKDDGTIGSASAATAMTIDSSGIVTFVDDIKIKDDGTIGSASAATAMTIDASGIVTFVDDIKIKDGGTIGSATTPTAITVASDGIVTFADDIKIKNDGTIGSAGAATAMTIDSSGIVTFVDDIKIKDGGTIGVASTADAMTISSGGIVTFKDDILVKDGGTIGSATTAGAITVAELGAVTLADDLGVDGNAIVTLGLGVAGNTAPEGGSFGGISLGTPANVVIRTGGSSKAGNVIIGDPTATTGVNLDVRGAANTGALTSTAVTISGLTASRALQTDGSKGLESSAVTTTELGRLSGVTGDIQTQLDAKIATTASASNDFITFTRLNANVNAVMANVDEKSGTANTNAAALASGIAAITAGGTLLKAHTNSNVQAAGSTANTFFIGAAMPGDGLANILSVALDGVVQQKDVPSGTYAANNDFIINAAAAHASIKFTAPSIPVGSTVVITALKA